MSEVIASIEAKAERVATSRLGSIVLATLGRATAVRVPRMAAALVFYLLLSMAPLLVVVVGLAGLVVGPEATEVYQDMLARMAEVVGPRAAELVAGAVAAQTRRTAQGLVATVVGIVALLWSASRGFNELQDALNTIWDVAPPAGIRPGLVRTLRQRSLSFLLSISAGALLVLYTLVRPTLNAFGQSLAPHLPNAVDAVNAVNAVFAFLAISLVLAVLYRSLPEAPIAWSDVWLASLLVALVLTVGQVAFTVYLRFARELGFLGAAASPLVVLAIAHFAVQAVYFGATFSHVALQRRTAEGPVADVEALDSPAVG